MLYGSLFSTEFIQAPPVRAQLKRAKPPKAPKPLNLSQFSEPDQKPVFIGQNVYIKPTYIVSMPEYSYNSRYTSQAFIDNQINLKNNEHNGELSKKAVSSIRNAVNWLLNSARKKRVYSKKRRRTYTFQVSFITLTLPDTFEPVHNREFQNRLLNPFLTYLRKYHGLKNYIWKMEFQKNGKLHAHLTTDCFLYYGDIRRIWNKRLRDCGMLTKFKSDNGHSNPNSTDVHSVYKVKNLGAYLAKYLSKSISEAGKMKGRIWGCSYELSRANKASVHVPASECAEHLYPLMDKSIEFKALYMQNKNSLLPKKFAEIYLLKAHHWKSVITGIIKAKFNEVRASITSAIHYFDNVEFNSC